MLVAVGATLLPGATSANVTSAARPLGQVRYILHGLTVQAPKHRAGRGKLKQAVYNAYRLQTKKQQKASVGFRDGSLLHLNQLTDVFLRSGSLTQVRRGEVEEMVTPGTNHKVKTAAAVASAIGTNFDVKVNGKTTIITVVEGAVLVTTAAGSVVVKSGQQVTVRPGQAPGTPTDVDVGAATAWTAPIPGPASPLGLNIALDANGGHVYAASSERDSADHGFDASSINDGRMDRGWQSVQGAVTEQTVSLEFQGGRSYRVNAILLDCSATGGEGSENDLKDFAISVSTAGKAASDFSSVLQGTCERQSGMQRFTLASPVDARYLMLVAHDNYGGADGIAVAELAVISPDEPATLGTPTPAPTETPTETPTNSPTVAPSTAPTVTPVPTDTPTAASTPTPAGGTLAPVSCAKERSLKSIVGETPASIQFVNNSANQVLVYWLNYQGLRELYKSLAAGSSYVQATFLTHPWVVTDPSGTCIAIFEPQASPSLAVIGP